MSVRLDKLFSVLTDELPTPGAELALLRTDGTLLVSSSEVHSEKELKLLEYNELPPVVRLGIEQL